MARFRATPYARALHDIVVSEDPKNTESFVGELEIVAEVVTSVPEFLKVMVTPMVTVETKNNILDEVLSSLGVSDLTKRFVHVVQQHYRLEHMPQIAQVYREIVDRALGRVRASVEVAAELDASQRSRVLQVFSKVLGTTVIADFVNNPELLAGFRVQVGSKVFDGSLVGQLEQLSRETHFE